MVQPIFPKAVVPWTDRIDEINTVWANDPNSLAAEVIAVESTLGVMPQVEKSPYTGNPVTYGTVDARVSDVLAGTLQPYCSLTVNDFKVYNNQGAGTGYGQYVRYGKNYDPYSYYNGSDITIRATGLYIVNGWQSWEWHNSGFLHHSLFINGVWNAGDMWQWNFTGTGPQAYTNNRFATTNFCWVGVIPAGQRLRVVAENGTNKNPYSVANSWLRLYCLRKMPSGISG